MTLVKFNRPSMSRQNVNPAMFNSPLANLFDTLFSSELLGKEYASFMPAVNVQDLENEYQIDVSAAGFEKDDFKLEVSEGSLIVSGSHKAEKETNEKNFLRKEFNYGSFQRTFSIPEDVNAEGIDAKYENGILKVKLPKKQEMPKNKIEIKVS